LKKFAPVENVRSKVDEDKVSRVLKKRSFRNAIRDDNRPYKKRKLN